MKIPTCLILSIGAIALPSYGSSPVTDPQIAAVVVTANQVDIDAGKFVSVKSTNTEVQDFANTMVRDHSAVNESAVELVQKLKVTPEESDTSRALKHEGDQNLTALHALSGMALDKAYIDHEVAYHEQVIEALDTVLIPGAHNAELKALLIKVRPAFVAHLDHAKRLQASYQ